MNYQTKLKEKGFSFIPVEELVAGHIYAAAHEKDGVYFVQYLGDNKWSGGWKNTYFLKKVGHAIHSPNTNKMKAFVDMMGIIDNNWKINNEGLISLDHGPKVSLFTEPPKPKKPARILNDS